MSRRSAGGTRGAQRVSESGANSTSSFARLEKELKNGNLPHVTKLKDAIAALGEDLERMTKDAPEVRMAALL